MDFGGELRVIKPVVVCQIAGMAGLTGRIKLITANNGASLYFKEGKLIYATIDTRRKRIGEILVERGMLDEETLRRALNEYSGSESKKRIGDYLIENGELDYKTLVSVIKEQIKNVVYTVLQWENGNFVYFDGIQPEEEDILLDVRIDYLLLEGLKKLDERERN
ncbi:MAG: DUF4388 domain-containing protein [Candidatus Latescibacteria bacterium]|nr:DUF4388 domain-containing protein [bacterium]MBD3423892.1 DUF4388 domain-containing protein [Candidatus Latescibacterota bacterium]